MVASSVGDAALSSLRAAAVAEHGSEGRLLRAWAQAASAASAGSARRGAGVLLAAAASNASFNTMLTCKHAMVTAAPYSGCRLPNAG
jgi:hypothetical protein